MSTCSIRITIPPSPARSAPSSATTASAPAGPNSSVTLGAVTLPVDQLVERRAGRQRAGRGADRPAHRHPQWRAIGGRPDRHGRRQHAEICRARRQHPGGHRCADHRRWRPGHRAARDLQHLDHHGQESAPAGLGRDGDHDQCGQTEQRGPENMARAADAQDRCASRQPAGDRPGYRAKYPGRRPEPDLRHPAGTGRSGTT